MIGRPRATCWTACVRGCEGRYPIDRTPHECPTCGGLMDVEHDVDALRSLDAEEWKVLLRSRAASMAGISSSGVWSKREWVLPAIEDRNIVSLGEGRTPLVRLPRLAESLGVGELQVKQCGTSHSGSFKDLGMTVLVSAVRQMIDDGAPIEAMICASTGDTSAALAAYGAYAGIPTVVLLPEGKITDAQMAQPLANGAIVVALDSDFDGCMRVVRELARDPRFYLANSKNALRIEGQKTVAFEVIEQLDWEVPDWIVIPCGNLGNVSALGKGLLLLRDLGLIERLPRIAAVQAERANPLVRSYRNGFRALEPMSAGETHATAIRIGDPVSYERAVKVLRRLDGVACQATEEELVRAAARADRHGLYTCPQTGVALAGAERLALDGTIGSNDRVVIIATAHGLKFTEFKAGADRGACATGVLRSPATTTSVSDLVRRALDARREER